MSTLYTSLGDLLENSRMAHFSPVDSVPLSELCEAASVSEQDLIGLCKGLDEVEVGTHAEYSLNMTLIRVNMRISLILINILKP